MKAKRKTIFTIISILLFFFSLAVVFFFRNWLLVNPFQPFELSEVITAYQDQEGNLYVIDKSGERLLKASPDRELLWQVKASDDTFEKAVRLCVDPDGSIYVEDKRIKSGIRLSTEAVLKFSPDGTLEKTVFQRDSSEDQIRPSIIGLNVSGDTPFIALTKKNGITIRSLISSEKKSFPLSHTDDLVLNAVWDQKTGTLWYCTFHGRIYRYVDGKHDDLIYDNSKHVEELESVPRAISCLDDTVYAADRGLRCLLAISIPASAPTPTRTAAMIRAMLLALRTRKTASRITSMVRLKTRTTRLNQRRKVTSFSFEESVNCMTSSHCP